MSKRTAQSTETFPRGASFLDDEDVASSLGADEDFINFEERRVDGGLLKGALEERIKILESQVKKLEKRIEKQDVKITTLQGISGGSYSCMGMGCIPSKFVKVM